MAQIAGLLGKTLVSAEQTQVDEIRFTTTDGLIYIMYHNQDCCETVEVESIVGELEWLVGNPLLMADEVTQEGGASGGTATWTFYKLATIRGYVTIRWYGESNGYYSESVYIRVEKSE